MQIATVSIILRISRAPHPIRVVAAISLLIAIVAAILALFLHHDTATEFLPAVSSLLYLIAPVSMIRHLVRRTVIDLETILGAVAAYLLIGMFFAFVYRAAGANEERPSSALRATGHSLRTSSSPLRRSRQRATETSSRRRIRARVLRWPKCSIGQLFLVTAVAKVINLYRPAKKRGLAVEGSDSVGGEEPP